MAVSDPKMLISCNKMGIILAEMGKLLFRTIGHLDRYYILKYAKKSRPLFPRNSSRGFANLNVDIKQPKKSKN